MTETISTWCSQCNKPLTLAVLGYTHCPCGVRHYYVPPSKKNDD